MAYVILPLSAPANRLIGDCQRKDGNTSILLAHAGEYQRLTIWPVSLTAAWRNTWLCHSAAVCADASASRVRPHRGERCI